MRELVKDERTRKIAGSVSLLVSMFLLIAFTSYLFTWKEDQDKVFRGASILLPSEDVQTANLLGNFGAYISHMFFYNGFGLASFLFCTLFFVAGTNAIMGRKIFSIWRNVRYVLVGIVFFSVLFAFFARTSVFPWGGCTWRYDQPVVDTVSRNDWHCGVTVSLWSCIFYLAIQSGIQGPQIWKVTSN